MGACQYPPCSAAAKRYFSVRESCRGNVVLSPHKLTTIKIKFALMQGDCGISDLESVKRFARLRGKSTIHPSFPTRGRVHFRDNGQKNQDKEHRFLISNMFHLIYHRSMDLQHAKSIFWSLIPRKIYFSFLKANTRATWQIICVLQISLHHMLAV